MGSVELKTRRDDSYLVDAIGTMSVIDLYPEDDPRFDVKIEDGCRILTCYCKSIQIDCRGNPRPVELILQAERRRF